MFAAASDSFLDKFLRNTISLAPAERADALNVNDDIEVEHQAVAEQGDSRVRSHSVGFVFVPNCVLRAEMCIAIDRIRLLCHLIGLV